MHFAIVGLVILMAGPTERTSQLKAVKAARETLARELGVQERTVTVRDSVPVEWPDAALGCPEKGMMYAQMITPGYRMVLEAEGRRYDVHTGNGRAVVCRLPRAAQKADADTLAIVRAQSLARTELARKLGWPRNQYKVTSVRAADADDIASCGPAPEGGSPEGALVVTLEAGDKPYRYLVVGGQARECPSPES